MSRPTTSVIIPTYNDPIRLNLALYGWSQQTRTDFEVIVVNDGGDSDGSTERIVQAYSGCLQIKYAYLYPTKRDPAEFRPAAARNLGLENSCGEYSVFADGDVVPHRDFIRVITGYYRPFRVILGCRKRIPKEVVPSLTTSDVERIEQFVYQDDERLTDTETGRRFLDLKDSTDSLGWSLGWGFLFSAKSDHFKELGGFDERFTTYGAEDFDMAERLCLGRACAFYALREAVVYHLDHPPRYLEYMPGYGMPYQTYETMLEIHSNWTAVRNASTTLV